MSTRAAEFTRQRKELEREIAAQEAKKLWDSKAGERKAAAAQRAEESRQIAKKLFTDPASSADLILPSYDGRFGSPQEVTDAIKAAFAEFEGAHALTDLQRRRLIILIGFSPQADITRVEVWNTAWQYMQNLLDPQEPAPSAPDATGDSTPEPAPVLTGRAKERPDHAAYEQELANELGKPWNDAIANIEASSGLRMEVPERRWLFNEMTKSGQPFTVANIRKMAISKWGSAVGLTDDEAYERALTATFESMTSDSALAKLGIKKLNTGAAPTGGYRASRY